MRKQSVRGAALPCIATVMLAVLNVTSASAATIFQDDFNGSAATDLNGQPPDIRPGSETWVAAPHFKANGFADASSGGNATLAFTPVDGEVYTIDCSLTGVAGDGDWFAVGFADGQSTATGNPHRFLTSPVIGKAWMFLRGDASAHANQAWLGNAASGTGDSAAWGVYPNQSGGDVSMRIVLDTTGGTGNWTATWYAKKPADADYSLVRATANLLSETITSVGFAVSNPTIEGTIENFTLSDSTAPLATVTWYDESTAAVTTNSALASATVETNLSETVLVWDAVDQSTASTNDWTYRQSLGSTNAGVVSGHITGLAPDTSYTWRLYGANSLTSGWSAASTFATQLTDANAPAFAGATPMSPNLIRLSWQDNASTETGYVLQRSADGIGGPYVPIATLPAGTDAYTDNGVLESTAYFYQLAATNDANGSVTDFAQCRTNAMTGAWAGRGELVGPYTADANTLHLWHLDEADPGPALPAPGVTNSFPLMPGSGAALGAASYAGHGAAGDTSAQLRSGLQGSAIPVGGVTRADGAFTFEALISTANATDTQQIIAMENNNASTARPFQFRIDADTTSNPPGAPSGSVRFINIAGAEAGGFGSAQGMVAPIPTTGDHAFVPDQWFHVAVTYNGNENTADNLKIYWTRLDARPGLANEIGSFNMQFDLAGITTVLGVGNDYRTAGTGNTSNLEGLIDEVRISDIARSADQMLFAVSAGSMLIVR